MSDGCSRDPTCYKTAHGATTSQGSRPTWTAPTTNATANSQVELATSPPPRSRGAARAGPGPDAKSGYVDLSRDDDTRPGPARRQRQRPAWHDVGLDPGVPGPVRGSPSSLEAPARPRTRPGWWRASTGTSSLICPDLASAIHEAWRHKARDTAKCLACKEESVVDRHRSSHRKALAE
jgi:hypothetical protein